MPSNTITLIDEALEKLAAEKSIEAGLVVASHVLAFAGVGGLKSNDPTSADYTLLTALKLPNAERYDHWFQAHPKFKSNRACFALNDVKQSNIEAKFYALKTKKKMYISGAVHFTSNFEDAQFTRQDPNAKVGVDFFLPPSNDSLLVVVSNNKSLRVVELKDRLTNTQRDIFAKWFNVAALDREQLHLTIWESFKLKSINEAFYKGIANSFKELVSHLESVGKSSNEARHFANRLHGRLLFCWFLDKKGFINRDVDYFNKTHTDATQYYQDKLELLFFDTLNTPQPERERSHPDQKTPYLNGGLFEAQPDDWRGTGVSFPQGFFVRLYDHFGEFNFTTDESTPDYEQIAIDPEMLGKIFENLLAEINEDTGEQARKAKGAFYTPREIVAYMCRESVREYLYTATKAGDKAKTSIDKLLDTSDSDWAKSGTNSKRDAVEPVLREKIVKALDEMKVLDPACGSGAFPIGMLHLLVQIYERLDARFDPYKTKLGIMERNIYGVDIEPLAIEIARLRSFLALVVDQEYVEKKPNGGIDTLPNLEFKFVCANTLIPLTKQNSLGDSGKYETLLEIKREYFKATPKQREKLETKYNTLRQQGTMFDSKLSEQLQTYDPFNNDHPAGFYDQHLMHDITEGFNVIIGNPPYVNIVRVKQEMREIYKKRFEVTKNKIDLYAYFIERSNDFLSENSILSFIIPHTWKATDSFYNLRKFITSNFYVFKIANLKMGVFDATVNPMLIFLSKNTNEKNPDYEIDIVDSSFETTEKMPYGEVLHHPQIIFDTESSRESKVLFEKIEIGSIKLCNIISFTRGIKTSDDKRFVSKTNTSPEHKMVYRGRNVKSYSLTWTNEYVWYRPDLMREKVGCLPHSKDLFEVPEKLVTQRINSSMLFHVAYDNEKSYFLDTCNVSIYSSWDKKTPFKLLLGILNSTVINFWYTNKFRMPTIGIYELEQIPIKLGNKEQQKQIITYVEKILELQQVNDVKGSSVIQGKIDKIVFEIYELSKNDISLIEEGSK